MTETDNRLAMRAAVARWIEEAKAHPRGAYYLEGRADWMEAQLQTLSKTAELNMDPPGYLQGLTAFDLSASLADLRIATTRLRDAAA